MPLLFERAVNSHTSSPLGTPRRGVRFQVFTDKENENVVRNPVMRLKKQEGKGAVATALSPKRQQRPNDLQPKTPRTQVSEATVRNVEYLSKRRNIAEQILENEIQMAEDLLTHMLEEQMLVCERELDEEIAKFPPEIQAMSFSMFWHKYNCDLEKAKADLRNSSNKDESTKKRLAEQSDDPAPKKRAKKAMIAPTVMGVRTPGVPRMLTRAQRKAGFETPKPLRTGKTPKPQTCMRNNDASSPTLTINETQSKQGKAKDPSAVTAISSTIANANTKKANDTTNSLRKEMDAAVLCTPSLFAPSASASVTSVMSTTTNPIPDTIRPANRGAVVPGSVMAGGDGLGAAAPPSTVGRNRRRGEKVVKVITVSLESENGSPIAPSRDEEVDGGEEEERVVMMSTVRRPPGTRSQAPLDYSAWNQGLHLETPCRPTVPLTATKSSAAMGPPPPTPKVVGGTVQVALPDGRTIAVDVGQLLNQVGLFGSTMQTKTNNKQHDNAEEEEDEEEGEITGDVGTRAAMEKAEQETSDLLKSLNMFLEKGLETL